MRNSCASADPAVNAVLLDFAAFFAILLLQHLVRGSIGQWRIGVALISGLRMHVAAHAVAQSWMALAF